MLTTTTNPSNSEKVTVRCEDANRIDCAAILPRTTDCDVEVTYTYHFENVGVASMHITEIQRTRGNSTVDLINEVYSMFLLPVGKFTQVYETETVNFCVDNTFTTNVTAKADPPASVPCEAMDMYTFNTVDPPVVPATPHGDQNGRQHASL